MFMRTMICALGWFLGVGLGLSACRSGSEERAIGDEISRQPRVDQGSASRHDPGSSQRIRPILVGLVLTNRQRFPASFSLRCVGQDPTRDREEGDTIGAKIDAGRMDFQVYFDVVTEDEKVTGLSRPTVRLAGNNDPMVDLLVGKGTVKLENQEETRDEGGSRSARFTVVAYGHPVAELSLLYRLNADGDLVIAWELLRFSGDQTTL